MGFEMLKITIEGDNPKQDRFAVIRSPRTIEDHRGRLNEWILRKLSQFETIQRLHISGVIDRRQESIDYSTYSGSINLSYMPTQSYQDHITLKIEAKIYTDKENFSKVDTYSLENKTRVTEFLDDLPDAPPLNSDLLGEESENHEYRAPTPTRNEMGLAHKVENLKVSMKELAEMPVLQRFGAIFCDGEEPSEGKLGGATIYMDSSHVLALFPISETSKWLAMPMLSTDNAYKMGSIRDGKVKEEDEQMNSNLFTVGTASYNQELMEKILRVVYPIRTGISQEEVNETQIYYPTMRPAPMLVVVDSEWGIAIAPRITEDYKAPETPKAPEAPTQTPTPAEVEDGEDEEESEDEEDIEEDEEEEIEDN